MHKRTYLPVVVVIAFFLLSSHAWAGTVLYNNGAINGNTGSWSISFSSVVSDSFTLTGPATLTGVTLGLWTAPADLAPASLEWRIGTSAETTVSGTVASLTNVLFCSSGAACGSNVDNVYQSSFSLPNVALSTGTYYLSLDFGLTAYPAGMSWDINNGPSVVFRNGINAATVSSNSNSFEILGDLTTESHSVPEPASIAMILSGLALVAGLARRKTRA